MSKDFEHYQYGLLGSKFLLKHWFWFTEPIDIKRAAMVNFFSYHKIDKLGWQSREALTTMIDLSPTLDNIWSGFRQNFIAKQIKKAENNGIVIKRSEDYQSFAKLYKHFRKDHDLPLDRVNILRGHSVLLLAYHRDQVIAGGIFITNQDYWRAYILASWHPDNSGKQREILGQANRLLIWQAIKEAKAAGAKYVDLGGISPQSNKQKLVSLAEFKEAFGGQRQACYYYFKVYSPLIKWWLRIKGFKNI